MLTRTLLTLVAVATTALSPVRAGEGCAQTQAVYTERDNGYVLSFRKPDPWEAAANTMTILDLAFPDGETHLWGWIWLPNGTSHDKVAFFTDACVLPTFDPAVDIDPTAGSTHEELEACTVWEGVILALAGNDIEPLPWFDSASPAATLLLPDLGPTIRYSGLVLSPGDEPHDVFTFERCAS